MEPLDHSSEENQPSSGNVWEEAETPANQDHEHSHGSHVSYTGSLELTYITVASQSGVA